MTDSPLVVAHTPTHVPETVTCLACGYSLAGLTPSGVCPECAAPIERSLRGNMLEYANRAYVSTLLSGVRLVIVGLFAVVLWLVATPLILALLYGGGYVAMPGANLLIHVLDVTGSAISLGGWWLLTAPDPALRDSSADVRARRILRGLLLFIAAVTLLGFVAILIPPLARTGLGTLLGNIEVTNATQWTPILVGSLVVRSLLLLAKLASFFVGLVYVRALAVRIPDRTLHVRAGRLLWLVPLLSTVGWVCLGLGPLVAFYLYISALWRCGNGLKAARARMTEAE